MDGLILCIERGLSRDFSIASCTRRGSVQQTLMGPKVASFGGGGQVDGHTSVNSGQWI